MAEPGGESRGLLHRITGGVTERVVGVIDPDIVLDQVDVDALVSRIDADALVARIDMNALLARVDLNALLARVEPDVLLDRIDMNALLDRVDLNALLSKVDIEALLADVDLEGLVRRSGVPQLVAESTNQLAGSAIDLVRRQLVALDVIIDRFLCRLMRRDPDAQPVGPPLLLATDAAPELLRQSVSGHYTGAVTRAVSAVLDIAIITTSYTLG